MDAKTAWPHQSQAKTVNRSLYAGKGPHRRLVPFRKQKTSLLIPIHIRKTPLFVVFHIWVVAEQSYRLGPHFTLYAFDATFVRRG